MKDFISAGELAAHLRELVDDEDFITRTVRVHFPQYKKEVIASRRAIDKTERCRSVAAEPHTFVLTEQSERLFVQSLEFGSQALHGALWREHPGVLAYLALNGQGTVMPPRGA